MFFDVFLSRLQRIHATNASLMSTIRACSVFQPALKGSKMAKKSKTKSAPARKPRKLAGKTPTAQIAKTLNRSVAAITFKAFTLRLSLRLASSRRGRRLKVSRR
jgi:hypothetical protein